MNAAIASVPLWLIVLIKSAILLLVSSRRSRIRCWPSARSWPGCNCGRTESRWTVGMLQPAADALKMMFKEDLTPNTPIC